MRLLLRLLAAILFLTLLTGGLVTHGAEAATRPTAPRAVKATAGNQTVKITWAAPSSNGGSTIDAYAVQQRNAGTTKWVNVKYTTGSGRSATITSLQNGALYYFRVLARNRVGWGSASASVPVRPRTVPTAPRSPVADSYDRALGVYWSVPFSTGGATIDYYRVEISTDAATWSSWKTVRTLPTQAAPVKFNGLTPNGLYYFRVRAHNAAGFSTGAGAGPFRVFAAPGAVTNLTADPGNGTVALDWDAPAYDPATPWFTAASEYRIEQSADDGTTWTPSGTTTATDFEVAGLVNGQNYRFRVSARSTNARLGYGPWTEVVSDPPLGAPGVPQNITLGWDAEGGTHVLDWDLPANDGGSTVLGYEIEPTEGGVPGTTIDVDGAVTESAVGDLALDNSFRVRACNAIDCGAWSDEIGPIPGAVANLDGEALYGTSGYVVTLDWDAPANNPLAPAASYTVLRSTDGVTFAPIGSVTETTFADTTAAIATAYTYRVVAVGTDGSGAPAVLEIATGPAQALSAPDGPLAVDEGGTTGFQVTFAAAPAVDTVVTVTSDDPAVAEPTQPTVTILAGTTSAQVTVAGVEDDDLTDGSATLTVSVGALSDTVDVDVADDDTQEIVLSSAAVQAEADGPGVDVVVSLAYEPESDVTVSVESDATNKATVSVPSVVLTPANWATGVPVTVFGESPGSATLTFSAPGLPDVTVEVTVD